MKLKSVLIGSAALCVASASFASLDVASIVDQANATAYYQGKDGKAKLRMTIEDGQGRVRERALSILRRDDDTDDGNQKFYVYFERPTDVKGTAFLVWKQAEGPDERWLYLPALDLVKRIAAGDERTSFVGSHFFYEDVSGRSPFDDVHELVEETDDYYVLKSSPREVSGVEFASYTSWIHKGTFLAVKIEYSDEQGKVYRTYEALDVQQIEGFYTVMKSRMSDSRIGGSTVLTYEDVDYDNGFEDNLFQERSLRTPPRRYLR